MAKKKRTKRKAAPKKRKAAKKKAAPKKRKKAKKIGKRKRKYYVSVKRNPSVAGRKKKKKGKKKKGKKRNSMSGVSLKAGGAFSQAHRMNTR